MSKLHNFASRISTLNNFAITERMDTRIEGTCAYANNSVMLMWWAVERDGRIHVCSEEVENSTVVKGVAEFQAWCATAHRAACNSPIETARKIMSSINLNLGNDAAVVTAERAVRAAGPATHAPVTEAHAQRPSTATSAAAIKNKLPTIVKALRTSNSDTDHGLHWSFGNVDAEHNTVYGTVTFTRAHPERVTFEVYLNQNQKTVSIKIGPKSIIPKQSGHIVHSVQECVDFAYQEFDVIWPGQQDHLLLWDCNGDVPHRFYRFHRGTHASRVALDAHDLYVDAELSDNEERHLFDLTVVLADRPYKELGDDPIKGRFTLVTVTGFAT